MKNKKVIALLLTIAVTATTVGCGARRAVKKVENPTTVAEETTTEEETSKENQTTEEETTTEKETETPDNIDKSKGYPWTISSILSNVPEEQPDLKDDFYASVNYDLLQSYKESGSSASGYFYDISDEIESIIMEAIEDTTTKNKTLKNIQTVYNMLADKTTMEKQDLSEFNKLMDMIDSVENIEDLNEVICDSDFSLFSFIYSEIGTYGTDGKNMVSIVPQYAFVDQNDGAQIYAEMEEEVSFDNYGDQTLEFKNNIDLMLIYYNLLGLDTSNTDDLQLLLDVVNFEAEFGKYAPYNDLFEMLSDDELEDYFYFADMDEMEEMFGDFPIKGVLEKNGRADSEQYICVYRGWIKYFADLYNDDNIDLLKWLLKFEVINELQGFIPANDGTVRDTFYEYYAYETIKKETVLSHALGDYYTTEVYNQDDIDIMTAYVEEIRDEYIEIIKDNDWISEELREAALAKLNSIKLNILIPEGGYYDYSKLKIDSSASPVEVGLLLRNYYIEQENKTINKPALANGVWKVVSSLEVNAMYVTEENSINILPGIISDLTYKADNSKAENLGKLGIVIAHEICHSLDDSGAKFNKYGRLEDIFTKEDHEEYNARVKKMVDYLNTIYVNEDTTIDGKLVRGEAMADIGAIKIIAGLLKDDEKESLFIASARLWAECLDDMYLDTLLSDVHLINCIRVNALFQQNDDFYKTFDIKEGDGMYLAPENRIDIW